MNEGFSKAQSVGKKSLFGIERLRIESKVSQGRVVWPHESDSEICGFDSRQCGRGLRANSDADLRRFLAIAMGSASELEYQALLAHDLGYIEASAHQEVATSIAEVKKMQASLIQKLTAES